jgi:hypothetical protein
MFWEALTVNHDVAGSSPAGGAIIRPCCGERLRKSLDVSGLFFCFLSRF